MLFLTDFDKIDYSVFKQSVVLALERAKEQSEVWVGTMIGEHIDRNVHTLEQAMHAGNIPIARMYLRDLENDVYFAERNQLVLDQQEKRING